jgi:hypothetical protein
VAVVAANNKRRRAIKLVGLLSLIIVYVLPVINKEGILLNGMEYRVKEEMLKAAQLPVSASKPIPVTGKLTKKKTRPRLRGLIYLSFR